MNRNLVAIAVALATSTLVVAQEKYTLKLKKSEKGDISVNSRESIKKENVTVTGQNGDVVQEKKQNIVEKYKYTEEIIAKEAGKLPTKLLRTYSEATKKTGEDAEKLKFHGQKVLIE